MAGIVIAHLKSIFEMESLGADSLQSDLKKIQGAMTTDQLSKFTSKVTDLTREYRTLSDTAASSSGAFGKQFQAEAATTAASIQNVVTQAANLSSQLKRAEFGRGMGLGSMLAGSAAGVAGLALGGPVGGAMALTGGLAAIPSAIAAVVNKGVIDSVRGSLEKLLSETIPRGSASRAVSTAGAIDRNVNTGMSNALMQAKLATDVMAKMPDLAMIEQYNQQILQIGKSWNQVRFVLGGMQSDFRVLFTMSNSLAAITSGFAEKLKGTASEIAAAMAVAGGQRTGKDAMSVRNAAQVEAERMAAVAAKERLETELAAKAKLASAEAARINAQAMKLEAEAANILKGSQTAAASATAAVATATKDASSASTSAGAAAQGFASSAGNLSSKVRDLWAGLSSLKAKAQEAGAAMVQQSTGWSGLIGNIGKLGAASAISTGPIASLLGRMWALSYAVESVGLKAVGAVSGVSAIVDAGLHMKNWAVDVATRLEAVKIGLQRVTSDGGASWTQLTDLASKYGISVSDIAKPFQKLLVAAQSSNIVGQKFTGMIDGITAASSALALSKDDVSGTMRAFEQMFSKGVVRAEEFSQQLGDHLPAAAKVGLLTFRQMTGNAQASMLDFFNAMHKGTVAANEFVPAFVKNYKAMVIGASEGENTVTGAINRKNTAFDKMILTLDKAIGVTTTVKAAYGGMATVFDGVSNNVNVLAGAASALATVLVTRLAGPTVLSAFVGLGSAMTSAFTLIITGQLASSISALTISMGPLLLRMGAIAAAATAVGVAVYYMTSSAKADPLGGFEQSMKRANTALDAFIAKQDTATTVGMDRARNELGMMIAEREQARLELERLRDSERAKNVKDSEGGNRAFNPESVARIAEYSKKIGDIDSQVLMLKGKFDELNTATTKVFTTPTESSQQATKNLDELSRQIQIYEVYLSDIETKGLAAAKAQRELNTAMEHQKLITSNPQELAAYRHEFEKLQLLKARAAAAEKDDEDRYKNIILRAQDLINGVSGSDANKMAKMRKDLNEYAEALRRVGTASDEIAPKVAQLQYAYEMQASGINMATLTFKPFMALQRGLEGMADSFSSLAVSGQLSFKSIADAVKTSTLSIIKDLIAMTIKVGMVKPVLASAFGAFGSGGGGVNAGLFSGMFGMADGGVVNSPTYFPIGDGSVAKTGEMGPEAVLPIMRGSDGRMGVAVTGGDSGGNGGGSAYHVTYQIDARGAQAGVGDQIVAALREYDRSLPAKLADISKRT